MRLFHLFKQAQLFESIPYTYNKHGGHALTFDTLGQHSRVSLFLLRLLYAHVPKNIDPHTKKSLDYIQAVERVRVIQMEVVKYRGEVINI